MRRVYSGIPVAGGICIGTVKVSGPRRLPEARADVARADPAGLEGHESTTVLYRHGWDDTQKWAAAVAATSFLTTALKRKAADELGGSAASIFEAQQAIVSDPFLEVSVFNKVDDGVPLLQAVNEAISDIADGLVASEEEVIRARAADVYDVGLRFASTLAGIGTLSAPEGRPIGSVFLQGGPPLEEGVLVAHDLLPSELVMLDRRMLLGLVLEAGYARSSTYVILEALGIPTLVQVAGILAGAVDGETIIIDADEGFVVVEPHEDEFRDYASRILKTGGQTFYQATQAIMDEVRKPPESLS
ncbi:MAG: hypothetical protein GX460_04085 [Firmicutes bacterium]|nr:hypothetical protein [Bacillota bacterium]